MSHELRTPLNSLLILSEMLGENPEGNLSEKQREFAKTIYASGSDLLSLINDILDMAKIESGTMAIEVGELPFVDLREYVDRSFRPVSETRGIGLRITLDDELPRSMSTDVKRLQQVLRNLLSNSFKFTESGHVDLHVGLATGGWSSEHPILSRAAGVVSFAVSDTGIGIPGDKLRIIFEPFQQADTGTSRKYGGTGLGLSISREIARLLGGEIRVRSKVGEGSIFTFFVPLDHLTAVTRPQVARDPAMTLERLEYSSRDRYHREAGLAQAPRGEIGGDPRDSIGPADRVILIVEHDSRFAAILLDKSHELGFKGVISSEGQTGLALAREMQPAAITLDLRLPDMDGWVVLDRLKHDPTTRHIPVHVISVHDSWQRGIRLGAFAFLKKPVSRRALHDAFSSLKGFLERGVKELLVVEDNDLERANITVAIGNGDVRVTAVGTAAEALERLHEQQFDCMVLDLNLPDMSGLELLETIKRDINPPHLPVVVYTGRDLSPDERFRLEEMAETTIVKDMRSLEHLLDKTTLFLHRIEGKVKARPVPGLASAAPRLTEIFAGRKVLLVDDDARNIFALTSRLERWDIVGLRAENGRQALEILQNTPGIDLVLMDIMMPELDGYETIRAIRAIRRFRDLPIIALTAKAMKDDRRKCMEAGASDYLAKPVGAEEFESILRVWLQRRAGSAHATLDQERPATD